MRSNSTLQQQRGSLAGGKLRRSTQDPSSARATPTAVSPIQSNYSSAASSPRAHNAPSGSASPTVESRSLAANALQNAAQLLDGANSKEYFSGDRFQHDRDSRGEWLSRYRNEIGDSFDWRMENKMRTVAAAICYCLNIGTEPPGVDRPVPCANMQCWIDPNALQPPVKSLELIGNTLVNQYSRWQPKAKYEQLLDPTSGAVKRMCVSLRRHAKHERILFHYNGHGVPKPTTNGELWVFDKSYTLYVPLSIYDLLTWLGGPAIIVLDCSAAGAVVESFTNFIRQKAEEARQLAQVDPEKAKLLPDYSECILLGACGPSQSLPLTPATLPMDLFTSCLTTPLKIALKFFAAQSMFGGAASFASVLKDAAPGEEELIDKIPGKNNDRKTPLGELNWIYTAVTDTIAWSIFPRNLFQKYFRQDLLLASLLRNFLLATRIMEYFGCSAFSLPALPQASLIAKHPMWQSWDLCCEQYLLSLDKYLNFQLSLRSHPSVVAAAADGSGAAAASSAALNASLLANKFPREHINFFTEHLLAFEVCLEVGNESMGAPAQLPIVLQVLLSQVHRRRALILLARFLGKGSWAVQQALAVGIFPYIIKLLQSPDLPLREVLIFIWTKLLAYDKSCQADLIKEHHESYFVNHLSSPVLQNHAQPANQVTDRQRVMSGFVLCALCDNFPTGQRAVLRTGCLAVATSHLESESPSLRKWMCLLLGKMWENFDEARAAAASQGIPEKLCGVIADPVPEVRAAALFALGTFMSNNTPGSQSGSPKVESPGGGSSGKDRAAIELMLAKNFSQLVVDASPLVREELVIALAHLVESQREEFIALAHERLIGEESTSSTNSTGPMSVPPSPIHHSLASPLMYPLPSPSQPTREISQSNMSYTASTNSTGVLNSGVASPALRASSLIPASTLGRASSEASSASTGLALTLSPTIQSGQVMNKSTTPLSPLHLQAMNTAAPSSNAGSGNATPTASANNPTYSFTRPASSSLMPPSGSPPQGHRGSLVRAASTGSLSMSSPVPPGMDATIYNQRLLLWRVIRTLSHDPFPTVSAVAVALRRMLTARSFAPSFSQQNSLPNFSVQGSPLLSSLSALNTVPEQSLSEYSSLEPPTPSGGNRASFQPTTPIHHRVQSEGIFSLVNTPNVFEGVQTRPRSRPVSEIDQPTVLPPAHPSASLNQSAAGGQSQSNNSILSALGTANAQQQQFINRSPSPSLAPPITPAGPNRSISSTTSPAASPMYGSTLAPGQSSVRKSAAGRMEIETSSVPPLSFGSPNVIPPSTIYSRSAEYFVAPVGTVSNSSNTASSKEGYEDPETVLERLLTNSWRYKRNSDILLNSQRIPVKTYDAADRGAFDQIAALNTGFEQVNALLFHPFENMLVISEKRHIGIYDTREFERINQFSNDNARGSKISALSWINEQHQSLLLAGSDDGVVRLWKNVHLTNTQPEIVSAWLAVRSMPRGTGVGLVLDWQQETGHLLAAGPVDSIRVWDVEREICVLDLPVDSDSYVSSICSMNAGSVVFAGCGDGVVRMFDLRADNHQIHTVSRHQGSVVNVRAQRWSPDTYGDLVSGGINGDVHVCETRMLSSSLSSYDSIGSSVVNLSGFEKPVPLDAFVVHDHAPLMASGSRKQVVRIADFKSEGGKVNSASGLAAGTTVSTLKYQKGFMGQRLCPVTVLTFHQHQLMLAVGGLDSAVSLYAPVASFSKK